jgi:tRNA-2-methylthio-N6-dimethylallyladenosine synthase
MNDARRPLPAVHIRTFGCQMNELDSSKMARLLEQDGWRVAEHPEDADALVINTCTVREKPAHKVESLLGRYRQLKQRRPSIRIVVAGCYAKQGGRGMLDRFPHVDAVIGPDAVGRIARVLERASRQRFADVAPGAEDAFIAEPVLPTQGRVSSMVAIQRGCDHGCTYCIVPSVRGAERYRAPDLVLAEVRALVAGGVRDVMLLGQNVNRYRSQGWEQPDDPENLRFSDLLRRVAAVDTSVRVRFVTSNPWDLGDDLIAALAELDNICPHLHLPVQSGSDRVLARMGRPHTAEQYLDLIARLRAARPDVTFSGDILMGFPGETAEDVEETLALVDRVRYQNLYVFAYSPRPGTVASEWEDDVPREEKVRRLQAVLARQEIWTAEALGAQVGRTVRVLVEEHGRDEGTLAGRTPDFKMVHLPGPTEWIGREIDVVVEKALRHTLRGVAASPTNHG